MFRRSKSTDSSFARFNKKSALKNLYDNFGKLNYSNAQVVMNNTIYAEIVDRELLESMFNGKNLERIQEDLRSFKMLKDETFMTSFTSLLTFHRGYLNEIFDKFIFEAHQHGIIDYCYRQVYRFKDVDKLVESSTKVLTMYMLSAGFYIWLGSVGIACIVFIYEHVKFTIEVYLEN